MESGYLMPTFILFETLTAVGAESEEGRCSYQEAFSSNNGITIKYGKMM